MVNELWELIEKRSNKILNFSIYMFPILFSFNMRNYGMLHSDVVPRSVASTTSHVRQDFLFDIQFQSKLDCILECNNLEVQDHRIEIILLDKMIQMQSKKWNTLGKGL